MIVQTVSETRFIKICLTSTLLKPTKSAQKQLLEACYMGHSRLTETRKCTYGNSSVSQLRNHEAAFRKIRRITVGSDCTEVGLKGIY
jgi:hypothetical protein